MDIRKLKTILDLFEKSDVQILELNEEGDMLRLTKKPAPVTSNHTAGPIVERRANVQAQVNVPVQQPVQPVAPVPASVAAPAEIEAAPVAAPEPDPSLFELTSPMVGTFYAQPSTDEPKFVNVGDDVTEGDPVCVIEAMKLFNTVNAPVTGKIVSIHVENEQAVGYGDLLMTIQTK